MHSVASVSKEQRTFLFLQGPHGPFFYGLGRMIRAAGAKVFRVGFNAGDRAFWFGAGGYIPFTAPSGDWPAFFEGLLGKHSVTDIVLYGDTRPIHAQAIDIAREMGINIHVFEEGYMRPYWCTYERDGSNGNSRLMDLSIDDMRSALAHSDLDIPEPPARWGDMRQHIFYGALYHWFVLFRNGDYRNFQPHRALPLWTETTLYTRRLLLMPVIALGRMLQTWRIGRGGYPYHLALLQLEHDSSFIAHSPFNSMAEFLEVVIAGFATGAPKHHHLVFKAHPLENGQLPLNRKISELAGKYGISNRVHYVRAANLRASLMMPAQP